MIDIVARSLRLITEGAAKYPVKLPPGMASRHRLCTDMASAVKQLGYGGECGYNQLLYPTEPTTRGLLGFLVEKLPRSEEDAADDVLGANALLNRRISTNLSAWSKQPFVRHCCPNFAPSQDPKGPRAFDRRFRTRAFRSLPLSIESGAPPLPLQVPKNTDLAPSVLERACAGKVAEEALEAIALGGDGEDATQASARAATAQQIRDAVSSAALLGNNDGSAGGANGDGAAVKAPTLNELLKDLMEDSDHHGRGAQRGTRFTHATDFGQEVATGAIGGDRLLAPAVAAASSDKGGEGAAAEAALSAADAAKAKAENEQRARDADVASLEQGLVATEASLADGARALALLQDRARQAEAELASAEQQGSQLEKDVIVKTKTLEMLPKAQEHITALEGLCAASAQKLMDLGSEWEKHRAPLVATLRAKRDFATTRRARCKAMVAEMQKCRGEMQAMAKEVRGKEEQAALLEEELAKLPQNVNRTTYTYRIMDIISSIAKQKKEIDKIITEVATVQKEINATSEKLSRAEVLADEKIFSYAKQEANKKDQQVVSCYRHFGDLRARFDDLVGVIEAVGKREAESSDLSRKTEQLQERVSKNNMARIVADLKQVQEENAGLVQQLRAMKAAANQPGS